MIFKCLKMQVKATLVCPCGEIFTGENLKNNYLAECPRKGLAHGEGYELCKNVCDQTGHAEENALRRAGGKAKGGVLFLQGHYKMCEKCAELCRLHSVTVVREGGKVLYEAGQ